MRRHRVSPVQFRSGARGPVARLGTVTIRGRSGCSAGSSSGARSLLRFGGRSRPIVRSSNSGRGYGCDSGTARRLHSLETRTCECKAFPVGCLSTPLDGDRPGKQLGVQERRGEGRLPRRVISPDAPNSFGDLCVECVRASQEQHRLAPRGVENRRLASGCNPKDRGGWRGDGPGFSPQHSTRGGSHPGLPARGGAIRKREGGPVQPSRPFSCFGVPDASLPGAACPPGSATPFRSVWRPQLRSARGELLPQKPFTFGALRKSIEPTHQPSRTAASM
jgi:hypothetical protein